MIRRECAFALISIYGKREQRPGAWRGKEVVNAHPMSAMKCATTVIPPRKWRLRAKWCERNGSIHEANIEDRLERGALFGRYVRCPSERRCIPHVTIGRGNIEVSSKYQGGSGKRCARPVRERLHPTELGAPIPAVYLTAIRDVDTCDLNSRTARRDETRIVAQIRIVTLDRISCLDGCRRESEHWRLKSNARGNQHTIPTARTDRCPLVTVCFKQICRNLLWVALRLLKE
jgi:hypothetical protein